MTKQLSNILCIMKGQLYIPSWWNFQLNFRTQFVWQCCVNIQIYLSLKEEVIFFLCDGSCAWIKILSSGQVSHRTTLDLNMKHLFLLGIGKHYTKFISLKKVRNSYVTAIQHSGTWLQGLSNIQPTLPRCNAEVGLCPRSEQCVSQSTPNSTRKTNSLMVSHCA